MKRPLSGFSDTICKIINIGKVTYTLLDKKLILGYKCRRGFQSHSYTNDASNTVCSNYCIIGLIKVFI